MEYSHDDAGLVDQPIGYWSWAASDAVVTYIRAGLARFGLTQPQWWVLNQVVSGEGGRRTRDEVTAVLKGYLAVGDGLGPEIDALLDGGLLVTDGAHLRLTAEGEDVRARAAVAQASARAVIHEGIGDEEYVQVLKVLQRMIHNVGGSAWHH